ncbi:MAG: hypothetical protein ACLUB5_02270 [Bifidobacterium dentium]
MLRRRLPMNADEVEVSNMENAKTVSRMIGSFDMSRQRWKASAEDSAKGWAAGESVDGDELAMVV